MGVIFDLDQTLIDSSIAEDVRRSRNWSLVYELIPKFHVYNGIHETLSYLRKENVQCIIVTSSPAKYCHKVIAYWDIDVFATVCYHDTTHRKPHPEPVNRAISLFSKKPKFVLSLGDTDIDVLASNAAKVISVACLWGANNKSSLLAAKPSYILNKPNELMNLVQKYLL